MYREGDHRVLHGADIFVSDSDWAEEPDIDLRTVPSGPVQGPETLLSTTDRR